MASFAEKVAGKKNIDFSQVVYDRTRDVRLRFSKFEKKMVPNILETCGMYKEDVMGIVYFGNNIDITFTTRAKVVNFFNLLQGKTEEIEYLTDFYMYRPDAVRVYLNNIPITLPNEVICSYFSQYHGEVKSIKWSVDECGFRTGERVIIMNKEDLESRPVKSYVQIARREIYVKYYGQKFTCRLCSAEGHTQRECKMNKRNKETPLTTSEREVETLAPSNFPMLQSTQNQLSTGISEGNLLWKSPVGQISKVNDKAPTPLKLQLENRVFEFQSIDELSKKDKTKSKRQFPFSSSSSVESMDKSRSRHKQRNVEPETDANSWYSKTTADRNNDGMIGKAGETVIVITGNADAISDTAKEMDGCVTIQSDDETHSPTSVTEETIQEAIKEIAAASNDDPKKKEDSKEVY